MGHIGQQLDGIVAKHADALYRPGDDRGMVKIKNYRSGADPNARRFDNSTIIASACQLGQRIVLFAAPAVAAALKLPM
jgi:ATP-dependent DNA ligase